MIKNNPVIAIMYDFDGTLAPGDIENYNILPKLGLSPAEFTADYSKLRKPNEMDLILAYMYTVIAKAKACNLPIDRGSFMAYGTGVSFYAGVEQWFQRINEYGAEQGLLIEHYIISSNLKEIIEGTIIAPEFKGIFGSCFYYAENGDAAWPANVLNYTGKTQILFRISKGCLDISDEQSVNNVVEGDNRHVKFKNMIYIGDGKTDVPCMKLVRSHGGHSIAVYGPERSNKVANQLKSEGRADFVASADYREGRELDSYVKMIIDKIAEKLRQ